MRKVFFKRIKYSVDVIKELKSTVEIGIATINVINKEATYHILIFLKDILPSVDFYH